MPPQDDHPPVVDVQPTLADGLAGNLEAGSVTIGIVRERVSTIVDVDENEIAAAIRRLAFDHGLVVEGSAAVAIAALCRNPELVGADGDTAVVLTGRNIAPVTFREVVATGT